MPPTVQSGSRNDSRSRSNVADKKSELVCRVKFNNTLPDIPFDPKFITYPFEPNRFVQYNPTSLERSYKFELLTEHDLGVNIDLINPDTYKIDPTEYISVEDERLLEDEVSTQQDSKRSRHHNRNVSWLRKTEYISTEYNRFSQSAEKVESKVGFNIKKYFKDEDLYKDRESQIAAIEETFRCAKTNIQAHHNKPNVYPVDVLPVFPDFEMWKYPCAKVIFDSDPSIRVGPPALNEEMSQAMIRGMVDESGDQFVAYFLPTEETCRKRKRDADNSVPYEEEDEYDYVLAREYNWNVKNKASKGYEETYFFVFKEDGVYYNELETRVRLSKRRKAGVTAPTAKSRLIVKHRQLNDNELQAQEVRLSMLEPPGEEEEEEVAVNDDLGMGLNSDEEEEFKSGDEEERSDVEKHAERSDSDQGSHVSRSSSRASSRASSRSSSASSRASSVGSRASSRGSKSSRSSRSGSESEEEGRRHRDEEEIFGSSSSSEED